jgi:hypothetical protein
MQCGLGLLLILAQLALSLLLLRGTKLHAWQRAQPEICMRWCTIAAWGQGETSVKTCTGDLLARLRKCSSRSGELLARLHGQTLPAATERRP